MQVEATYWPLCSSRHVVQLQLLNRLWNRQKNATDWFMSNSFFDLKRLYKFRYKLFTKLCRTFLNKISRVIVGKGGEIEAEEGQIKGWIFVLEICGQMRLIFPRFFGKFLENPRINQKNSQFSVKSILLIFISTNTLLTLISHQIHSLSSHSCSKTTKLSQPSIFITFFFINSYHVRFNDFPFFLSICFMV
jgi:hypothetical protein